MTNEKRLWITIPNWDKFQHYTDRTPAWIKAYTAELLSSDAYRSLPLGTRGVLHGLWAYYALARGVVPADPKRLSSALGATVYRHQLERLNHAGFIRFRASAPRARARALAREEKSNKEKKGAAPARKRPAAPQEVTSGEAPDPAVAALLRRVTDSIGKP